MKKKMIKIIILGKNVQPAGIEFKMRTSENIAGYTSTRQLVVLFPNMLVLPVFCIKRPGFLFYFSFFSIQEHR